MPKPGEKGISNISINNKELNKSIAEGRLTIKDLYALISGSNPTGGLSNAQSDPLKAIITNPWVGKKSNKKT